MMIHSTTSLLAKNQSSNINSSTHRDDKTSSISLKMNDQVTTEQADISIKAKQLRKLDALKTAQANTDTAIAFLQSGDSAVASIQEIVYRIRVLALQSSNGPLTDNDRQLFQVEVSSLIHEMNRISEHAYSSGVKMLNGDFSRGSRTASLWFHIGPNMNDRTRAYVGTITSLSLNLATIDGSIIKLSTAGAANDGVGTVDAALHRIRKQRGDLHGYMNSLKEHGKFLEAEIKNLEIRMGDASGRDQGTYDPN